MRKLGVRVASAALAACMMASVLPVGAFAAGNGYDGDASTYAEDGSSASTPLTGNITAGGTYTMSGSYTKCIVINTSSSENKDVTINMEGSITSTTQLFRVINVGKLTINSGACNVNVGDNTFLATDAAGDDKGNIGGLEINGGIYECKNGFNINKSSNTDFAVTFEDVSINASNVAVSNNSGGKVTIKGGTYTKSGTGDALFLNGGGSTLELEKVRAS